MLNAMLTLFTNTVAEHFQTEVISAITVFHPEGVVTAAGVHHRGEDELLPAMHAASRELTLTARQVCLLRYPGSNFDFYKRSKEAQEHADTHEGGQMSVLRGNVPEFVFHKKYGEPDIKELEGVKIKIYGLVKQQAEPHVGIFKDWYEWGAVFVEDIRIDTDQEIINRICTMLEETE